MSDVEPANPALAVAAARIVSRGLGLWYWRRYLNPHWPMLVVILVLLIVEGTSIGLVSRSIQPLFDEVFAQNVPGALLRVGLTILGLFALRALVSSASTTLSAIVTQKVAAAMQGELLAHVLTLDMRFFQAHPPGALIERIRTDTLTVQSMWSNLMMGLGRDGLSLLVLLVVAFMVDPTWLAITFVGVPLLLVPTLLVQRQIAKRARALRKASAQRTIRLDEIFHGIQAIKLNQMEAYQEGRYGALLRAIFRGEVTLAFGKSLGPSMVDIVFGIGFFAVLMVAGPDVASGARTTGEFMSFLTSLMMVFPPLRRLGALSGTLMMASISLERVHNLLQTRPDKPRTAPDPAARAPSPGGDIRFEDVIFAHGDHPVLRGLSFTAQGGKTTALVGASGAGKSTVFHLLTGLFDPDRGIVSLDGVDLTALRLPDQRGLFACVTQDATLFDESLRENILPGGAGADEAALARALHLAHVAEFLPRLPEGVDTRVGPRGSALSGGQRQRVAIARALIKSAPILLFDEATSALDAQSEAAVTDALREASAERTTLVIAHRLSTVRSADKIVVLDHGRVAEEGTHEALLAKGGLYADLYAMQFKDRPR